MLRAAGPPYRLRPAARAARLRDVPPATTRAAIDALRAVPLALGDVAR